MSSGNGIMSAAPPALLSPRCPVLPLIIPAPPSLSPLPSSLPRCPPSQKGVPRSTAQ